jgi:hypothetical protein
MASGGISPSGKVLRWWVWRLPKGVATYSWNRNLAAATEEGRRVLALAAFGLWVAGFWFAAGWLYRATGVMVPLQIASLMGLLLIWRIVGLGRRWWKLRGNLTAQAVSVQRQREMYEMQRQALAYLRGLPRQALPDGGLTIMRSSTHDDPTSDEARRVNAEQQRYARDILGDDQQDIPLGDRFEPIIRLPRFRRRKRGDQ